MRTRTLLNAALMSALISGCAGLAAPPTTIRGAANCNGTQCKPIKELEAACNSVNTQTVENASLCAQTLQHQYTDLALRLLEQKSTSDIALLTGATAAAGVTTFEGSKQILKGLTVLSGGLFGLNSYIDRKKIGTTLLSSANGLQCLSTRAKTFKELGVLHQSAMTEMKERYDKTEKGTLTDVDTLSEVEKSAMDAMYSACASTLAAVTSGGYKGTDEAHLAAELMARVHIIDAQLLASYYSTGRDLEASLKVFADKVKSATTQVKTMEATADTLKQAQEAAVVTETKISILDKKDARAANVKAVDEVIDTTINLQELIIDMDACVVASGVSK